MTVPVVTGVPLSLEGVTREAVIEPHPRDGREIPHQDARKPRLMANRFHWLAMLLTAGVLAIAAESAFLHAAPAHAAECSVCEFSDDEGEVFP